MRNEILTGNALEILPQIPSGIVQCCVTSPPYYGLRDYGVEGQLGNESTPQEYVDKLVSVFREVRRTLRDDGVLWLNLGDSYAGYHGNKNADVPTSATNGWTRGTNENKRGDRRPQDIGLKPKDLIGVPWRVAFALQDDGWYLRSDCIWSKGNCMPESVKDRPTKSHEYVFLLSKSPDYFYDQDAIREPNQGIERVNFDGARNRLPKSCVPGQSAQHDRAGNHPNGRNKRTVWTINPKPYKGAHFAVMPEELARLCIEAGTSQQGCCGTCGAPLTRVVERVGEVPQTDRRKRLAGAHRDLQHEAHGQRVCPKSGGTAHSTLGAGRGGDVPIRQSITTGWQSQCCCAGDKVPCIVLDPFSGAGTTAVTATKLGRSFIGIELNPSYVKLSLDRLRPVIEDRNQRETAAEILDTESAT